MVKMICFDPGHSFALRCLSPNPAHKSESQVHLRFIKRVGDRYPGNVGEGYEGTNCQEVLRALISRSRYLNNQIPCAETEAIINHLRTALLLFEIRAAREHKRVLNLAKLEGIEDVPACVVCGHIHCPDHAR
jgi:hypothetical protein